MMGENYKDKSAINNGKIKVVKGNFIWAKRRKN